MQDNASGKPDDDEPVVGIVRGRHGDPARDPKAVLMIERQSYERLIDGLRIAAEASMHLARYEAKAQDRWRRSSTTCAAPPSSMPASRITLRAGPTEEVRRAARVRPIDGLKQAKGGARQLRMDLTGRRCGARDR